jgi:hypothetical protein
MFGASPILPYVFFLIISHNSPGKSQKCVPLLVSVDWFSPKSIRVCSLLKRSLILAIYNAIHRGIEPELIPVCRRFGIQIVCYNPLAGYFHPRDN